MQYLDKLFDAANHRHEFQRFLERLTAGTEDLGEVFDHLQGQRGSAEVIAERRHRGETLCTAAIWLLAYDASRTERNRPVGALEPQTELLNLAQNDVAGFVDNLINNGTISLDTTDGFGHLELRKYWDNATILQADVIRYLFRPSVYTKYFEDLARSLMEAVAKLEAALDGADLSSFNEMLQRLAIAVYQASVRDRLIYAGRAAGASAPHQVLIRQCLSEVWDRQMQIWADAIWALWRAFLPRYVADEYSVELLASSIQTYIDGAALQLVWAPDNDQAEQLFTNGLNIMILGWFTFLQEDNSDEELEAEPDQK